MFFILQQQLEKFFEELIRLGIELLVGVALHRTNLGTILCDFVVKCKKLITHPFTLIIQIVK